VSDTKPLAPGDLLTVRAALALVPVGRSTLYAAIESGELPHHRFGAPGSRRPRILNRRADLAAYVERARHGATRAPVLPDVDALHAKVRRDLARSGDNSGRPAET